MSEFKATDYLSTWKKSATEIEQELRDQVAFEAVRSMIDSVRPTALDESHAKRAWAFSDAFIAERRKRQKEGQ